jgi:CHAT domain-containing protein
MHPGPDRDNGLLTGEEIGGLDLRRCDLAVLSACETALGQPAAGDGLLSLTRAFREAGARTVISSLWSVNDASTRMLMLDFYDRLWNKGESKLDALRHAQLAILEKNLKDHKDTQPATWGAFILTGETR